MSETSIRLAAGASAQARRELPKTDATCSVNASRRWPWFLAGILVIGFVGVVLVKTLAPSSNVWTDDAYVAVHYATVAPRVSGQIANVPVDDNQVVRAGQVLATLDPRDYAAAVARAAALLERDRAQVDNATAAIERQPSLIEQARARVTALRARSVFSRQDDERYQYLADKGAASAQKRQLAQATADADTAALKGAEAAVAAAERTLDVLRAQREAAEAIVRSDEAALAQARLNLSYTRILAPVDGTIAQRAAQVGDTVSPGTALMALVPLRDVYVVANYREIALRDIRPGQKVRVHVDAYGIDLQGIVDDVAPASGATFSPIAPNNATGNFTKIVQRLPVKIAISPGQPLARLLRVGLSVETTIQTSSKVQAARASGSKELRRPRPNQVGRSVPADMEQRTGA
jgi:membrane fusion protein (multidrug efflux system)